MLSNKAQLQTKTKSSEHIFQCDPQTPLPEVYEALTVLRTYVFGRLKEQQEQEEQAAKQAPEES